MRASTWEILTIVLLVTLSSFGCDRPDSRTDPRGEPDPQVDLAATPEPQVDLTAAPDPKVEETLNEGSGQGTAVFAGGCFWCTEAVFEQLEGVTDVVSGYAGGRPDTANYGAVSSGRSDHAEAIRIGYDPDRISYDTLLEVFFTVAHDPTQKDRQGPDVGRQYRSAIFHVSEDQKRGAEEAIRRFESAGTLNRPIVTTLEALDRFHPAEEYHQDYVERHPNDRYVLVNALPKVRKLRKKFADRVRGH